jgi:ABC-type glycerol-3-phosphate transport system permease component
MIGTAPSRLVRQMRLVGLLAVVVFAVGPLLWMVVSSLKPATELFTSPPALLPKALTAGWYVSVWTESDAPRWFFNSLVVAVVTTAINAVVGVLGAHGVARFRYPGRRAFVGMLLVGYMFPVILLLIPLYLLLESLRLLGTLAGVVLAHLVMTLPFSIWMMRSFIVTIPRELEQAALVDGCSEWGAFLRVTLPLCQVGLVATSLFAFVLSWNEYLLASVITSGGTKTLPVGIAGFVSAYDVHWGEIMALGTLVTVPIIVGFAIAQSYFEKGLLAGGVKG